MFVIAGLISPQINFHNNRLVGTFTFEGGGFEKKKARGRPLGDVATCGIRCKAEKMILSQFD